MKTNTLSNGSKPKSGIVTLSHPFKAIEYDVEFTEEELASVGGIAYGLIISFSILPASFVFFLVAERSNGAKHLQYLTGLRRYVYWIANFLWDASAYLVVTSCIVGINFAFQREEFIADSTLSLFLCLLLFYGLSIITLSYLSTFVFKVPSKAFINAVIFNVSVGLLTTVIGIILFEECRNNRIPQIAHTIAWSSMLIFPQFCFGYSLFKLAILYKIHKSLQLVKEVQANISAEDIIDMPNLYSEFIALILQTVFNVIMILMLEYNVFQRMVYWKNSKKDVMDPLFSASAHEGKCDDDVQEEERNVMKIMQDDSSVTSYPLQVSNLRKKYPGKQTYSVNGVSFSVSCNECFGLLGVNGAGKTSTFKMLTGLESVTSGEAKICGYSVKTDLQKAQEHIGFCPQFDALFDSLTGREILTLYGLFKGIHTEDLKGIVDFQLDKFNLNTYADRVSGSYSGGNKRKLSAAIALLGDPQVIFLDEPTAGMDPGAKRFLWNRIRESVKRGIAIVLTSHSMEECEILCSRLTIMVHGKLKCVGTLETLKSRHGEGYLVDIRLSDQAHSGDVSRELYSINGELSASHHLNRRYKFPKDVSLEKLFQLLQQVKSNNLISDFSLRQSSLEEIFMSLAKQQSESADDKEETRL